MIPFGEFAPDQSDQNTGISLIADNCIADASSYKPLNGKNTTEHTAVTTTSTGTTPTGLRVRAAENLDYIVLKIGRQLFVGGAEFTPAAGTTVIDMLDGYPFVVWDKTLYIAGGGVQMQKITFTGLGDAGATKTTDITGSPPIAYCCVKIRDFLVVGSTWDGATLFPERVQWSGFDDPEEWTVGTNQSGFQDLVDGGQVSRIIGGEYGIIFQADKITRMTYIGAPLIFQFDEIESGVGTQAGQSVVQVGADIYYYSKDGFYVLKDGVTSIPIGANKIDDWFRQLIGEGSYYKDIVEYIVGAYDSAAGIVMWSFRTYDNVRTNPNDRILIYNIKTSKWSTATIDTSCLFDSGIQTGTSPNDFFYKYSMGAYTASGTSQNFQRFTGSTLAATIETSEISQNNRLTQLTSVRPVIDGSCTVTVSTRDKLTEAATSSAALTLDGTGKANTRTHARYHKIKVTTSGDFTNATGIEIDIKPKGKR